jgi:hypothetical protein
MKGLIVTVQFQTSAFYSAAIAVNICLCHDLIYTLRDPFKSPEARYPMYFSFIMVCGSLVGLIRAFSWN